MMHEGNTLLISVFFLTLVSDAASLGFRLASDYARELFLNEEVRQAPIGRVSASSAVP
jgi:hypothetical protein